MTAAPVRERRTNSGGPLAAKGRRRIHTIMLVKAFTRVRHARASRPAPKPTEHSLLEASCFGAIAGFVNANTKIRFDTFGGMMTGNTINFAIRLQSGDYAMAGATASLLAAFVVGGLCTLVMMHKCGRRGGLVLPPVVLAGALVLCDILQHRFPPSADGDTRWVNALISSLAAFAMGGQNMVSSRPGIGANSSFLTGTLKRLSEALYKCLTSTLPPAERLPTAVLLVVWTSNVLGALLGAALATSLRCAAKQSLMRPTPPPSTRQSHRRLSDCTNCRRHPEGSRTVGSTSSAVHPRARSHQRCSRCTAPPRYHDWSLCPVAALLFTAVLHQRAHDAARAAALERLKRAASPKGAPHRDPLVQRLESSIAQVKRHEQTRFRRFNTLSDGWKPRVSTPLTEVERVKQLANQAADDVVRAHANEKVDILIASSCG